MSFPTKRRHQLARAGLASPRATVSSGSGPAPVSQSDKAMRRETFPIARCLYLGRPAKRRSCRMSPLGPMSNAEGLPRCRAGICSTQAVTESGSPPDQLPPLCIAVLLIITGETVPDGASGTKARMFWLLPHFLFNKQIIFLSIRWQNVLLKSAKGGKINPLNPPVSPLCKRPDTER